MAARFTSLPRLGVGISAEPLSAHAGIHADQLLGQYPGIVDFLEYGSDVARGLDEHVRGWAAAGRPTTYHFLDVNLEEPDDLDEPWMTATRNNARAIGAAWLCGDAGLWHFGPRERGHQLLLPPVLTRESARAVADSIRRLEDATGFAVLPENPPGTFYIGDLHLLDYFAEVGERADCGLLLDCAHLAMYQRLSGHPPTAGLDGFPRERLVELHVAGTTIIDSEGLQLYDDAHGPEPLPDTWQIFEAAVTRAPALRAVVYECERNSAAEVAANFARLRTMMARS